MEPDENTIIRENGEPEDVNIQTLRECNDDEKEENANG